MVCALFHSTDLLLTKWFLAIFLMALDMRRQNITSGMASGRSNRVFRR